MSDITKTLADKAREAGKIKEGSGFFAVTDKRQVDAGGGQMVQVEVPNGDHRVKILSEKTGKGNAYGGGEQIELQMIITDNGVQKMWNTPVKNPDGTLHYLILALEPIAVGEEFIVRAKKMKNGKFMKEVVRISGGSKAGEEGVPTIQLNDEDNEGDSPKLDGGDDIDPSEIPF